MSLLTRLKNLNTDAETLDEIELAALGNLVRAEYDRAQVDTPEWLVGALDSLDTNIKAKSQDMLKLRLKEIDQAEQGLRTAQERRADLAKQRELIERRLGKAPVTQ